MAKKYPMMVTLKEASKIYEARVRKQREKEGWAQVQMPAVKSKNAKKINRAITLTILAKEVITNEQS